MPKQLVVSIVDEKCSLLHCGFKVIAIVGLTDDGSGLGVDCGYGYRALLLIVGKLNSFAVDINEEVDCHCAGLYTSLYLPELIDLWFNKVMRRNGAAVGADADTNTTIIERF
jgi:hypothetical protein